MKIKALGAVLAKRFGVAGGAGSRAEPSDARRRRLPQALEDYQAKKRAHKAEMRAKQQA